MPLPKIDIDRLTVDQRLELIERLWESIRRDRVEELKSSFGSVELTVDLDKSRRRPAPLEPEG